MEDLAVDILQGIRFNTVVYCIQGFVYQRTHVRNQTTFCRCRVQDCTARLSFRVVNEPTLTGVHIHDPEAPFVAELRLRAALVQRALNEDTPPRQIFDEESLRFPLAAAMQFPAARNIIVQARRRGAPVLLVNSLRAAAAHLRLPNQQWLARRMNGNVDDDFLGGAQLIDDGSEIMTLRAAPLNNYDGVLVVSLNTSHFGLKVLRVALVQEQVHLTLGYSLITRPSVAALIVALQQLLPLHRLPAVGSAKTAYVTGLRAAMASVLPNWNLLPSPFLLHQGIIEEIARVGALPVLRNNEHMRAVAQRLASIPFLTDGERDEALMTTTDFTRQEQPALLDTVRPIIEALRTRLGNFAHTQHMPIVDEGLLRDLLLGDAVVEREELALLGVLNTPSPTFWIMYKALRRFDGRPHPNIDLPMGMANRAGQQAALRLLRGNIPLQEYVRRVGHTLSHTTRRLATTVRRDQEFVWGINAGNAAEPLAPPFEVVQPQAAAINLAAEEEGNPDEPGHPEEPVAVHPEEPVAVHPEEPVAVHPEEPVPVHPNEPVAAQPAPIQPDAIAVVINIVNQFPAALQEALRLLVQAIATAFQPRPQNQAQAQNQPQPHLVQDECIICMDNQRTTVLWPCGHSGYCATCAGRIDICAICREEIFGRVLLRNP